MSKQIKFYIFASQSENFITSLNDAVFASKDLDESVEKLKEISDTHRYPHVYLTMFCGNYRKENEPISIDMYTDRLPFYILMQSHENVASVRQDKTMVYMYKNGMKYSFEYSDNVAAIRRFIYENKSIKKLDKYDPDNCRLVVEYDMSDNGSNAHFVKEVCNIRDFHADDESLEQDNKNLQLETFRKRHHKYKSLFKGIYNSKNEVFRITNLDNVWIKAASPVRDFIHFELENKSALETYALKEEENAGG